MATINLLPWRQERRRIQTKGFLVVLTVSAFCTVLIILYMHLLYNNLINVQKNKNNFLRSEIKRIEKRISAINAIRKEKEKLLKKTGLINKLQKNRPDTVELFNTLVEILPNGMHYINIKRKNNVLNLIGISESKSRVAAILRNIKNKEMLMQPKLDSIKAIDLKHGVDASTNYFNLTVKQNFMVEDK